MNQYLQQHFGSFCTAPRQKGRLTAGLRAILTSPLIHFVLFGALTHALGLEEIDWEEIIRETVPPKFLELNLAAYRAGRDAAAQ